MTIMTTLQQVEEDIDMAMESVKSAQAKLSLVNPQEAAVGGALSAVEVALNMVSEVVEKFIVESEDYRA